MTKTGFWLLDQFIKPQFPCIYRYHVIFIGRPDPATNSEKVMLAIKPTTTWFTISKLPRHRPSKSSIGNFIAVTWGVVSRG